MKELKTTTRFTVRFSEVDSMNITWHGSYVSFFEDAREAFGKEYGIDYLTIFGNGYYAPLVDIHIEYKSPLIYGDEGIITAALHTRFNCQPNIRKFIFEIKNYFCKKCN